MASSIASEPEPPPSLFNVIPGGSYILQLPGSGLLVRGENMVRVVVATGLKWMFGGTPVADPEPASDQHDTEYNALHSAVHELVEMFDDEVRDDSHKSNLSGIDLLRATKIRVRALENEVKAERQARVRAESRIVELERIRLMVEEQMRDHMRLEAELQKVANTDRELFVAERQMEDARLNIQELAVKCQLEPVDLSSDSAIEQTVDEIRKEIHEDGGLRAQIHLTVRKEMQCEMLLDQRHREFAKLQAQSIFEKE